VARTCQASLARQENHLTTPPGRVNNDGEVGSSEKKRLDAVPINTTQNKESPTIAAEFKEEDLYGDWLVVNKKKNQGSKTIAKNHGTTTKAIGGANKKVNDSVSFFSPLNNAGLHLNEEIMNLNNTPQFNIGGGVDSTKVWTKRNKRARGMDNKHKEPKKTTIVSQPAISIVNQPRQTPPQVERQAQIESNTNPIVFSGNLKQKEKR
jgi:hypothetical protein